MQFETLDVSGDAGIRSFGKDLREVFINAALGMYSLITDLENIREIKKIEISSESGSLDGLLVSWLNDLIFHFDVKGFIAKKIEITDFPPGPEKFFRDPHSFSIRASLSGEEFDPARHEGKLLVKAATYHKLKITKTEEGWESEVIFDI